MGIFTVIPTGQSYQISLKKSTQSRKFRQARCPWRSPKIITAVIASTTSTTTTAAAATVATYGLCLIGHSCHPANSIKALEERH